MDHYNKGADEIADFINVGGGIVLAVLAVLNFFEFSMFGYKDLKKSLDFIC